MGGGRAGLQQDKAPGRVVGWGGSPENVERREVRLQWRPPPLSTRVWAGLARRKGNIGDFLVVQ